MNIEHIMEKRQRPITSGIKNRIAVILFAVLFCSTAAFGEWAETSRLPKTYSVPLANDPMNVTVHRLTNGLTVYLSENHQTPRITANIVVRAGGRHDPREATGMAHYLEHLLFKGSRKLGTIDWKAEEPRLAEICALYEMLPKAKDEAERKQIFKQIDEASKEVTRFAIPNELDRIYKTIGFDGVNAFTADEMTVFTLDFPRNRLETWATIEADRFLEPVFRLFQSELETVYEEKNRSMDNPERELYEAYAKAMFPDHPYSVPILGTVEHLKNPSLQKLQEFYSRYYCPNNMAIAAAGDFNSVEMLKTIDKHFSAWQPKPLPEEKKYPLPFPKGIKRVNVQYEAEEKIIMGWMTVKQDDPDRNALILMDMLVDNSAAGILNLYLNQQQKVKASGSFPSIDNEAGTWQLWGKPKDVQTLQEVETLLLEVVAKLKNGDFEQSDIDAVITDLEVSRKRGLESNGSRVGNMVESFGSYEDWADTASWLKEMQKLTKADVLRVANKYLTDDRVVATRTKGKPEIPSIAKPEFTKIPIEPGRKSAFFAELLAIPAPDIEPRWIAEGRDYQVREGAWGKLVAVKNPVNDLFSLSFTFKRGWRHEKELRYADTLWSLAGAGDLDAEAFKKKLYSLGSSMSFWCGEQESGASISGLEKNFDETLALLKKRFKEPNIKPDDLAKMIEVELANRKDSKVNPDSQLNALRQWAQRGKESSVLNDLSNEQLQKLDISKLKELLADVFDYRARVSYVGMRDADDVAKCVSEKGRKYRKDCRQDALVYVKPRNTTILFLHRDMVQSKIGMFTPDEKLNPKHWADYAFYSRYMGGDMSSVLFQEVRESRAMAYAVGGGYRAGSRKGDQNAVTGSLGTQADKTVEATALVKGLLAKLPASEDRFSGTRESIVQTFRTDPQTFRQIPWTVFYWDEAGISGGDPSPARMKASMEYSLKDLERFANNFNDRKWIIYILGSKDRVDMEALGKLGKVEMVDLDSLYPY